SGQSPFHAETLEACLHRVLSFEPQPLHQICPHLPEDLCEIVDRLLLKDPAERPETLQPFSRALERSAGDFGRDVEIEPTRAMPTGGALAGPPGASTAAAFGREGPSLRWLIATAVLLVAGGILLWSFLRGPSQDGPSMNEPNVDGAPIEGLSVDSPSPDGLSPDGPTTEEVSTPGRPAETTDKRVAESPQREPEGSAPSPPMETATGSRDKEEPSAAPPRSAGSSPPPAATASGRASEAGARTTSPPPPPEPTRREPARLPRATETRPSVDVGTGPAAGGETAREDDGSGSSSEAGEFPGNELTPVAASPPPPQGTDSPGTASPGRTPEPREEAVVQAPVLLRITPSAVRRGGSVDVTVSAKGLGKAPTAVFRRGDRETPFLSLRRLRQEGQGEFTGTLSVRKEAPLGVYTLTFRDEKGQESNTVQVEVRL
ncbi:MAG: hypothetical protein KDD47_24185, partial [Acidobacteria bacterium]|nr:hypothetical protein [Acidobacteriota bacterium]